MKLLTLLLLLITGSVTGQTLATLDKPGKWAVYSTGEVKQLDSLVNVNSFMIAESDCGKQVWVVKMNPNQVCTILKRDNGVVFMDRYIKVNQLTMVKDGGAQQ